MATALRSGYIPSEVGPGVSGSSGSGAPSSSTAEKYGEIGAQLGNIVSSSPSLLGDIMRTQASYGRESSALSQSYAERQMDFQREADHYAMAWSANQAAKNREWQERMSDTAHQREVKDLIAAGLNPILSANGGAVVGSGATGQAFTSAGAMGNVNMESPLNLAQGFFSNLLNSALTMASLGVQSENARINASAMESVAGTQAAAQMYSSDNALLASRLGHSSDQFIANLKNQSSERIASEQRKVERESMKYSGKYANAYQTVQDIVNDIPGYVKSIGNMYNSYMDKGEKKARELMSYVKNKVNPRPGHEF